MNPLQQMELARLDHQERLQQSQRNRLASQIKRKSLFNLSLFHFKKANASNSRQASIKRDIVAAN
ncbi:MAG: hypothetical protein ACK47M_09530 [Caldilinea sp.]